MRNETLNKWQGLLQSQLLRGSAVLFAASMLVNVSNYLFTVGMGRLLGPVDYGTFTALVSLMYIFSVPSQTLNAVSAKFVAHFKALEAFNYVWLYLRKVSVRISVVGVGLVLIVFMFQSGLANLFNLPSSSSLVILSILIALTFLNVTNLGIIQGLQRFNYLGLFLALAAVLKLGLGVLFAYLGFGVNGVLIALLIALIVPYILTFRSILPFRHFQIDEKIVTSREVLKFTLPMLVAFVGLTLIINQDVVLVKRYFSPHEAGLYAALALIGKIIFFATGAVVSVLFPIASSRYSANKDYLSVLRGGMLIVGLICAGSLVVYLLAPKLIVTLLFGQEYSAISSLVFRMGIFLSLYSLSYTLILFSFAIQQTAVAIIPVIFALTQGILLFHYHDSFQQVISLSTIISIFLLLTLVLFNILKRIKPVAVYEK